MPKPETIALNLSREAVELLAELATQAAAPGPKAAALAELYKVAQDAKAQTSG